MQKWVSEVGEQRRRDGQFQKSQKWQPQLPFKTSIKKRKIRFLLLFYSGIRTSGGTKGLAPMTAAASAEGVCLPDGDEELEDEEDEDDEEDDAVADLKKEL